MIREAVISDDKFPIYRITIGTEFGYLTVIEEIKNRNGRYSYISQCDCGKKIKTSACLLLNKTRTSCGCKKPYKAAELGRSLRKDLTGKVVGKLTVLYREIGDGSKNATWWRCRCECGKEKTVRAQNIHSGTVQSCGCLLGRKGPESPSWKGGFVTKDGYKILHLWDGEERRRISEHRWVMENMLGRRLLDNENVHHKNGIRTDNNPNNLELWVKVQPCGQRVEDLVNFCTEFLNRYEKDVQKLRETYAS